MAQQSTATTPTATSPRDARSTPQLFEVTSVEKATAPDGSESRDWYRYVLRSRRSTVTGQRRGSRKDVHAYATQCVEQMNTRTLTAQSIWRPRGRKPASEKV